MSLKFLAGFSGLIILHVVAPVFLLRCLGISDWVAGIVNLSLLGSEYFCIRINFLKLISEMQLGFLEKVWSFTPGLCNLLGLPGAVISPG